MKAILKFDLNDPDDRSDFALLNKATAMGLVLWEMVFNSRKSIERELEASETKTDAFDGVEMVFQRLFELMEENDINIDNLIQ